MKKRKIKKTKPMFKKKRSAAKTVLNAALIVILLLGIAFLGYSVGKPIVQFIRGRTNSEADSQPASDTLEPEPSGTESSETDEPEPTVSEPVEPEPEPEVGKRILAVNLPAEGIYDEYLEKRIEFAAENGYYGVSVELLCDGGTVAYLTSNQLAASASAISERGITDLKAAAQKIIDAGLVPYARISALSDHLASWDKSLCYLFENSTSTWLDNSISNGGKPWISPFSNAAKDYIGGFVGEITDAGFAGIIAGELEFPPFRNSDLNYIGETVKNPLRYEALVGFSNSLSETLGAAKIYAIEIDARDIVAGKAEILNAPDTLNCQKIYIKYDSEAIGLRLERSDGTEVSYAGLSEQDKLRVVFKTVGEALSQSGKEIIPAVSDEALIPYLVELGYDEQEILVY